MGRPLNLIFIFGIFLPIISSRHVQFFRKDYVYIDEFDAFYKVHWDLSGLSWSAAFLACDDEGTTLFYPRVSGEWALVKNLTRLMAEPPNVTDIFVGLHDEFGVGEFITVDGHSTSSPLHLEEPESITTFRGEKTCVLMNTETGLYRVAPCMNINDSPIPFICTKLDNESCPTIDRGYKYIKSLNKCYKVNKKAKMWDEAMKTCYMEGGILAVFENKEQSDALVDELYRGSTYHIGIRRIFSQSDYYTVKGQKYDEQLLRNSYSGNQYDCGAIYLDNTPSFTTADCGTRLPFICEMEIMIN